MLSSALNFATMRYYEQKFPEVDDLVMVEVNQIAEMGAYVKLLEYDGLEGMILLSELSRRRIRSIQKLIRVGRNEVVVVTRVDKDKGYIDLSKRRVTPENVTTCTEKYNNSKTVSQVLANTAQKSGVSIEQLYETVAWPLTHKYGHPNDAFKVAIQEPDQVYPHLNLDEGLLKELKTQVDKRYTKTAVKLRADISVTCNSYEGVGAIKEALAAGQSVQTEDVPISIKLVAPPLFVLTTSSTDKVAGIERLQAALDMVQKVILEKGGNMVVNMAPKAISQTDDNELAALMQRAEEEKRLVSGDEDSDQD